MKNCHNCDNYFCEPTRESSCGKCLTRRGLTGWRPMRWRTRVRFWLRRLFR